MSQTDSSQRFDLARFILGYVEHEGGLVAPPAYGIHEVVMPDEVARRLETEAYLKIRFDSDSEADPESVRLSVNHPITEAVTGQLLQQSGNAQLFVNHVRLDKKGLFKLAEQTFRFPNARLFEPKGAMEQKTLHHYLRFNFKVAFVSDERQEQIVPVLMDVQAGHSVQDEAVLERLISLDAEPGFPELSVAQPRWAGGQEAQSVESYTHLLERAQGAVLTAVAPRLDAMRGRNRRFLELDQARIQEYYDALETDLRRRQERSGAADTGRIQDLQAKIDALLGERKAKLADIQTRYQIRVELELINILRLVQPKIIVPVEINNRRTTITRHVVWDPLIHQLEELVCDVCGEPGNDLHLCNEGHLAHEGCMAPQCIDCKREYCQLCAQQIKECVVCHQPVCRPSLLICPTCGRGSCREHQELCHAADGAPASLPEPVLAAPSPPAPTPSPPKPPPAASSKAPKPKPKAPPPKPVPVLGAQGKKIVVEIEEAQPRVSIFVMQSVRKSLAKRVMELTPQGLSVSCSCEKAHCAANGWYHRPGTSATIQEQIKAQLEAIRAEYRVPVKQIEYHTTRFGQFHQLHSFLLPPIWRDESLLNAAREGFDHLS